MNAPSIKFNKMKGSSTKLGLSMRSIKSKPAVNMWSGKNRANGTESDLKEELLRRLSHTVQEVQLYYSQTGEKGATEEGTTALITILEAIFLHALKQTLLESARKSVSFTDDVKPAPSFFDAVRNVTHKDTISVIMTLNRVRTDVGRSRAWLRLALNEAAIPSYLTSLSRDRLISRYYRPKSLMRDKEALDTAARILQGLLPIPFDIPLNSSLLNAWSSEPLLISGLWSPALRNTPSTGVDVAETIEEDDVCSIITSTPSVRSLMTLDESQAIRIILDTPMLNEEHELPEEDTEEVDRKMHNLEVERRDIIRRSFSTLVESCSPQNESMLSFLMKRDAEENQKRLDAESFNSSREVFPDDNKISGEDLDSTSVEIENSLCNSVSPVVCNVPKEPETERPLDTDYEKILSIGLPNISEKESLEEIYYAKEKASKEAEKQNLRTIEEIVLKIPRESGLMNQKMECADCRLSIGFDFGSALLCNVTGEYLCENCHKGNMGLVPARIFFNWDHNKYPTGEKAATYLAAVFNEPIFNIETINPALYRAVADLQVIFHLRKQLNFLYLYNKTCKQGTHLNIREYLYKSVHLYSLADLSGVVSGSLKSDLHKAISVGKAHVVNCWICKEKGFVCEVCRNPQVIYPFDDGSIYRCHKCQAVYHGNCLTKERTCPKCKRRKQRQIEQERNT